MPATLADDLLSLEVLHLIGLDRIEANPETTAEHPRGLLRLTVETERPEVVACRDCGVLATDHGRREHCLADAPCFATPVQLIWRKRRWRCREPRCPTGVWSEEHPALPTRAKFTTRAVAWGIQTLRWDVSTVKQLTARGWVSTGTGTVCHDWLLHMFARGGRRPDIVAEVPDFTLHLELARHGLAPALVPRMGRPPLREELTTLVLRDAPARIVSVAHRNNQDDDPAITLLRQALLFSPALTTSTGTR